MKPYLIILLIVLASGCISLETQTGNPQEYELPGLNNTTIYYLNLTSIQVVESVANSTSVKLIVGEGGEMDIRSPVAVDYSGENVSFNLSRGTLFGKSFARFEFESPFSGFVAFTQPGGQEFSRPLTENGSVRVVLPVGYTTGSRFLGIAQPEPDNITVDSRGREVLIWVNPYPEHRSISVRYYQRGAPRALLYVAIALSIAVVAIAGYYYISMRALRKKRELLEKGIKK